MKVNIRHMVPTCTHECTSHQRINSSNRRIENQPQQNRVTCAKTIISQLKQRQAFETMSPQQEACSSGDDISIRHLHGVKGVSIYKVLAGGESETCETLASYNEAVMKSAAERDELNGEGSLQHQDWRAMYTQMLPEHVLSTVPYRWEKAGELLHEEAILIEATFEKLDVVILEHPLFSDAAVDGKTKGRHRQKGAWH